MRDITKVIEVKKGRAYETTATITDTAAIYESLAGDLIAKKLHGCTWITRINDRCNYDGTRTITVTYNNGCRAIYTVKA
jgi:hypothetical protein